MISQGDTPGGRTLAGTFQDVSAQRSKRRPAPFSLRLTNEERTSLVQKAGNQPLGAYIRDRLFESQAMQPRRIRRQPVQDDRALAKVLGDLGNAKLANNLNQLAKAANSGSLPVNAETLLAILTACRDVQSMRSCLMAALGLRE